MFVLMVLALTVIVGYIHVSELSIGDDDVTLRTAAGCRADTTTNL